MSKRSTLAQYGRISATEAAEITGLSKRVLAYNAVKLGGRTWRNERGHPMTDYSRAKVEVFLRERDSLATRPADPDLIFVEEAEALSKCCRQTLATIARKESLESLRVRVLDSLGKAHWRTCYRKSELFSHFFKRPRPGEPIRLPDGTVYYLRNDAKLHFGFSDIVLSYWAKQDSKLHAGKALRTCHVDILQGLRQGPPKQVTAWRGEDLEAIVNGQEGESPEKGKGTNAIKIRTTQLSRSDAHHSRG
jgi:hypothetical protein